MSEEFYIGYLDRAPRGLARFLRGRVLLLALLLAGLGAALTASQAPFDRARFEFGTVRTLSGIYRSTPVPNLALQHPLSDGTTRVVLVAAGKFGAGDALDPLDGRRVELEGTLVHREDQTMLELVPGSARPLDGSGLPATPPTSLGRRTLVGEIVDSKCYLGVMKPGHLKPHRACAVRCISGGIPPVLLVRDSAGVATYYLLTDEDGGSVGRRVLHLVAEPVRIEGEVLAVDNLLVLRMDPEGIERL